jgi:hypothetical protein
MMKLTENNENVFQIQNYLNNANEHPQKAMNNKLTDSMELSAA